jgi:hypothetical protein
MGKAREWLNERPGAAAIEADDRAVATVAAMPFNPKTEVSADAKYVVRRLVLWFLVLPAMLGLLVWGLSNIVK